MFFRMRWTMSCLGRGAIDVLGLEPFWTLLDFELHFGAVVERAITGHIYRAKMHEDVLTSRALDESIPLGIVKPLYDTFFFQHTVLLVTASRLPPPLTEHPFGAIET